MIKGPRSGRFSSTGENLANIPKPAHTVANSVLLEQRKRGLEDMIKERHRNARAKGVKADVSALSATLRKVKAELARAKPSGFVRKHFGPALGGK